MELDHTNAELMGNTVLMILLCFRYVCTELHIHTKILICNINEERYTIAVDAINILRKNDFGGHLIKIINKKSIEMMSGGPVIVANNGYAQSIITYNNNDNASRDKMSADDMYLMTKIMTNGIDRIDSKSIKSDNIKHHQLGKERKVDALKEEYLHDQEMDELYSNPALSPNSVILEEQIDNDYEPTKEEIIEYALFIGMDPIEDIDLLWIARDGLITPLPEEWKPCRTIDTDELYYFNFKTETSVWAHPLDTHFKALYENEKAKKLSQTKTPANAMINNNNTNQEELIEGGIDISPSIGNLNMINKEMKIECRKLSNQANESAPLKSDGLYSGIQANTTKTGEIHVIQSDNAVIPSQQHPLSTNTMQINKDVSNIKSNSGNNYRGNSLYTGDVNSKLYHHQMQQEQINQQYQISQRIEDEHENKNYIGYPIEKNCMYMLGELDTQVSLLRREQEESINEKQEMKIKMAFMENKMHLIEKQLSLTQGEYERMRNRLNASSDDMNRKMMMMQSENDFLYEQFRASEMAREMAEQQLWEMQYHSQQREILLEREVMMLRRQMNSLLHLSNNNNNGEIVGSMNDPMKKDHFNALPLDAHNFSPLSTGHKRVADSLKYNSFDHNQQFIGMNQMEPPKRPQGSPIKGLGEFHHIQDDQLSYQ